MVVKIMTFGCLRLQFMWLVSCRLLFAAEKLVNQICRNACVSFALRHIIWQEYMFLHLEKLYIFWNWQYIG